MHHAASAVAVPISKQSVCCGCFKRILRQEVGMPEVRRVVAQRQYNNLQVVGDRSCQDSGCYAQLKELDNECYLLQALAGRMI